MSNLHPEINRRMFNTKPNNFETTVYGGARKNIWGGPAKYTLIYKGSC